MSFDNFLYPCSEEHEFIAEFRNGERRRGYPLSCVVDLFAREYISAEWTLQMNDVGRNALHCLDHGVIYSKEDNAGMIDETFAYWRNLFTHTAISADAIETCGKMPVYFFEIQKLAIDFILHSVKNADWFIRIA